MSPQGKIFPSVRSAWRHFNLVYKCSSAPLSSHAIDSRDDADHSHTTFSPGMAYFLRSHSSILSGCTLASRADVLRAPPLSLGPRTEELRSDAVRSVLSCPLAAVARDAPPSEEVQRPDVDVRPKALAAAKRLLPFLPEDCFVAMAGGRAAYDATPPSERRMANLRTVCKAVGQNGDSGERLISYLERFREYRRVRNITGEFWPIYPCILSNFAVWLQLQSRKKDATSIAPRCISTFSSFSESLKLPVIIDSPHLGAVPNTASITRHCVGSEW